MSTSGRSWKAAVVAGLVAVGMATPAWAACVQVYEHDFIGQKCDSNGNVEYQGSFSSDTAGGTLTGTARIDFSGVAYQLTKFGTIASPLFKGDLSMVQIRSSTGAESTGIDQRGEWPIGNGKKLVGTIMVQCSGGTCQVNDQRVTQ